MRDSAHCPLSPIRRNRQRIVILRRYIFIHLDPIGAAPLNASPPTVAQTFDPARERALLLTLAGIQFAHILDFMIMMPLGPMLMRELQVGTHEFGLLVSAYTFSAAFSGLFAAMFIDRFERKRMLLNLFALFALATLACGLAAGFRSLLLARCAAGAFGGVLGSMVYTLVGDLIPFERRGSASGTVMSAFAVATIAGVPLSLFLANRFGWRFPFVFIAVIACGLLVVAWKVLPQLRGHLEHPPNVDAKRTHPLASVQAVLRDNNCIKALIFMAMVMFASFSVIPFITIHLTFNVGVLPDDIPLIYLVGGAATFATSRLIGHLADKFGKVKMYRIVALGSIAPLLIQTHLPPAPLWLVVCATTLFFILVSGRMTPAMAIVTSAVEPRLRGTFLSMNGAIQQLASGAAAYVGGTLISSAASGRIAGYGEVGYLAVFATGVAVYFVGTLRLYGGSPHSP